MHLAWSDEFASCPDGKPDERVWSWEWGYVRNQEMQFYNKDSARCVTDPDGGRHYLSIVAEHHPSGIPNPGKPWADSPFST